MVFNSPKNFKRGRLINNRFRKQDLMLGVIGIGISLALILFYMLILEGDNVFAVLVFCIPALATTILIMPYPPVYHNLLEFGKLLLIYRLSPKKFIWEGIYKYDILDDELRK